VSFKASSSIFYKEHKHSNAVAMHAFDDTHSKLLFNLLFDKNVISITRVDAIRYFNHKFLGVSPNNPQNNWLLSCYILCNFNTNEIII
jgi:hypothetical protein